MSLLKIEDLEFSYGNGLILQNLNLEIDKGEFVAIIGPNGVGKSTLLRLFDGILKPTQGSISLDGRNINQLHRKAIAKKIAYVPQSEVRVFPTTVYDTVLMGRKPHIDWMETKKDKKIVSQVLSELGLGSLALRDVNKLSGGQRQKVFIARALAQEPEMLLLDEPTANLDLKHQIEVLNLLKNQIDNGISVVIAIHDLNLALKYCDRIIVLFDKGIYVDGNKQIIDEEIIEKVYGVKVLMIEKGDRVFIIPEEPLDSHAHEPLEENVKIGIENRPKEGFKTQFLSRKIKKQIKLKESQ
ncbi:MAG: ABC transporter related protein [Promethearchaeota archaeon]|nr:MAG: ABC transporter related protein [Candidatus Lokiarchaeota archaeon]